MDYDQVLFPCVYHSIRMEQCPFHCSSVFCREQHSLTFVDQLFPDYSSSGKNNLSFEVSDWRLHRIGCGDAGSYEEQHYCFGRSSNDADLSVGSSCDVDNMDLGKVRL